MQDYEVRIGSDDASASEPFTLAAPTLPLALIVADINTGTGNGNGTAEIWHEQRRLARVHKLRAPRQTFWVLR